MRAAMTLRRRDIVTVVPRRGDAATGADDFAAGAAGALGAAATGAGLAEARTSSLRIRPPTPVPLTFARLTPCSLAN